MRLSATGVFNVSLVVAVVSIAALKAVTFARAQASPNAANPDRWVAFGAKVEILSPGGTVYGTFMRSSDGSTRKNTGPAPDSVAVVDIKNIARARTYRYHSSIGWLENPMQLPAKYLPHNIAPHLLRNAQPIKYEGFDALTLTSADRIDVLVPALNYFVVDRILPDGKRQRFSDIKVLESVPPETFELPVGVQAKYNDTPDGIIQHDRSEFDVDANGKVTWKKRIGQ